MQRGFSLLLRIGALFAAWTCAAPASAQNRDLPKADLPLVMMAYADAVVDLRNIIAACAPKQPGAWNEGAAVLVESLRAASVPEPIVSAIQTKLASPVAPDGIDCGGEDMQLRNGLPANSDWEAYHRGTLERAGVSVVEPVMDSAKLEAARAAVESAMPVQAHMLTCLSLFNAAAFVDAYGGWSKLLDRIAEAFASAGYGPHIYRPILEPAAAANLFQYPAARAEATERCVVDQSWLRRAVQAEWYGLAREVESALKGQP